MRPSPSIRSVALVAAFGVLSAAGALAQEPVSAAQEPGEALLVFLDCQAPYCDFDHFRREISFVNWMRDRQDAEVHVLITAQTTGGGGWEFTLAFIGRRQFAGQEDTLRYTSANTDTPAEIRDGLTQTIRLGLVQYAARTPLGARLRIGYQAPQAARAPQARPEDDPWNFWVFQVRGGGFLNGEKRQRSFSFNGSASASRVTDDLKIRLSVFGNRNRDEFDILNPVTDMVDTTIVSERSSWSASASTVWSLGSKWSFGVRGSVSSSTFLNQDLAVRAGPAIEYDLYPYSESTRRLIVLQYSAGVAGFDYGEETIFDRTSEVHPEHRVIIGSEIQQPWGSIDASITGTQFLHDLSKHNLSLSGGVNLRLVRGLDLRISGSISRIKDQLYISKAGLSRDEVLTRQQQLGTDFRYFTFFNLSYRFGSKFANIVNPRMRSGGGGEVIIMF